MATIQVTDRDGGEHTLSTPAGPSLMEVLRDQGDFGIAAICGGMKACATCHVYIADGWLGKLEPQEPDELELLDISFHYKPNSRLSCQIKMTDDLDGLPVIIAPED